MICLQHRRQRLCDAFFAEYNDQTQRLRYANWTPSALLFDMISIWQTQSGMHCARAFQSGIFGSGMSPELRDMLAPSTQRHHQSCNRAGGI
jgi:hypothetical protein